MLGEEDQSRNPAIGGGVPRAVFGIGASLFVVDNCRDQGRDHPRYLPRDPTTSNPMPPINAIALSIGEIGIVSLCWC
jgi:hypothetical protein